MIYLPTRDECVELVKHSEAFYVMKKFVEGQKVELYDYRLAAHSDFFPEDGSNWTELRGICFVEQEDGTWERNILMQKFFNCNQTIGWMYDDVKDKKITRVQNKEDGSIISFVKFANGKVRAKSKMSFESEQAQMAQEIYDNSDMIQNLVDYHDRAGLVCIFELVGPENQIVLEYQELDLILLQIRSKVSGQYEMISHQDRINKWGLKSAADFATDSQVDFSVLDKLLERKRITQDDIEGWVVTFEDGQMAKIKTDKYLSLHGLIGPDAFRENLLVKTILDGNIDDVISALVPGPKKDRIIELEEKVSHHFNFLVEEFKILRYNYFEIYDKDRKHFAIENSKQPLFGAVMKSLGYEGDLEDYAEEAVKAHILRQCNTLGNAKEYLEEL